MVIRLPQKYGKLKYRVNLISSKDTGETHTIYVWSDNKKVMWGSDTDNIIRKFFGSF